MKSWRRRRRTTWHYKSSAAFRLAELKTKANKRIISHKNVNILNLTWESPTLLCTFKLLMRAGEAWNYVNACSITCIMMTTSQQSVYILFVKRLYITTDTRRDCLYIVSENVNNSCSLIIWDNYSTKVIVTIVYPGSLSYWLKHTEMDDDDTWDFFIARNALKKMQVWWWLSPPLWTLVLKDKWVLYWLCSKLRKKIFQNYLHIHGLQGNTIHVHDYVGLTKAWMQIPNTTRMWLLSYQKQFCEISPW